MSKAGFPQEILDEITAVVANLGDHSVLASLSLASKEHFLRQCQSYIHRTLRINRAQPTNGSTQILKANPSLFGFAKELIIEDRPDYDINIQSTTEERRNHAQAILKIFEYATGGVETLLLHTNHLTRIRGKDTSEGDLELDGAVIRQFFTPRLVNLAFSTRNIPLHSFQSIPSLRSLRIETGDLLSNEGVSEGVGGHAEEFPWHLKSLQCVYDGLDSAAVLFKTSPRALCRSLVYITLNIQTVVQQRTAMSIVQEVAQDVSPRLEALELVYRGRSGKASHQGELQGSTNLPHMIVSDCESAFQKCARFLSTLRPRFKAFHHSLVYTSFISGFIMISFPYVQTKHCIRRPRSSGC